MSSSNEKFWQTLSSRTGYNHPFFKVREDQVSLPNGHTIPDFTVWENGNVAQVLAVTPNQEIILAKQYKHGAGQMIAECPGGYMDEGEVPEQAARRELQEEVGYTADEFKLLATFVHHPTKETSSTFFFLALNATPVNEGARQEVTEDIEIILVSFTQALKMIETGELKQTGTIAGILLAARLLGVDTY
jgi:ADP-ribose pyrophosphatase